MKKLIIIICGIAHLTTQAMHNRYEYTPYTNTLPMTYANTLPITNQWVHALRDIKERESVLIVATQFKQQCNPNLVKTLLTDRKQISQEIESFNIANLHYYLGIRKLNKIKSNLNAIKKLEASLEKKEESLLEEYPSLNKFRPSKSIFSLHSKNQKNTPSPCTQQ